MLGITRARRQNGGLTSLLSTQMIKGRAMEDLFLHRDGNHATPQADLHNAIFSVA